MNTKCIFLSLEREEFKQMLIEALSECRNLQKEDYENEEYILLTQKEVLGILGIKLPTLLSWRRLGIVQAIKINRSVRYRKEDIDKLLKELPRIKYSRNLGGVSL